jgi:hypothetical protein
MIKLTRWQIERILGWLQQAESNGGLYDEDWDLKYKLEALLDSEEI